MNGAQLTASHLASPATAVAAPSVRAAAHGLARMGLPVVFLHGLVRTDSRWACTCNAGWACRTPGEHLLDGFELEDATVDEATIDGIMDAHPHANVGIATGSVAGIIAVHVDVAEHAPELRPLVEALIGSEPPTARVPSSSVFDMFFQHGPGAAELGEVARGIAVAARGDYVIVAPSRTAHGEIAWDGGGLDDRALRPLPLTIPALLGEIDSALSERQQLLAALPPPSTTVVPLAPVSVVPLVRRARDIEPEQIAWLLFEFVPFGFMVVIQGDPGCGKSAMLAGLAALVSRGGTSPIGGTSIERGTALLLAAEDPWGAVIRPRLEAAEADLDRVLLLTDVLPGASARPVRLSLARDLEAIEQVCEERDVRFIGIDTGADFLLDVDMNDNAGVRAALAPLADLAARRRIAIVIVRHLTKARGRGPRMHAGLGSVAFAGLARTVMEVTSGEKGSVLTVVKTNLARTPAPVGFALVASPTPSGLDSVRIEWLGPVETAPKVSMKDRAVEWLRTRLAAGPVAATKMTTEATLQGIGERTLEQAKSELGVTSTRKGKGWSWALPVAEDRKGARGTETDAHAVLDAEHDESVDDAEGDDE